MGILPDAEDFVGKPLADKVYTIEIEDDFFVQKIQEICSILLNIFSNLFNFEEVVPWVFSGEMRLALAESVLDWPHLAWLVFGSFSCEFFGF